MRLNGEIGAIYDIWRLLEGERHENEAEIRACCRNAYLGGTTSLCRVLGRYKMYVDTEDTSISAHLMLEGFWEMWVTQAMLRHVRRGMTVLDIGANLGYYTLLLADLVGPAGRVIAFEPNPAMVGRLRQSVAINGFAPVTTVHEVALGASEGRASMIIDRAQPGGGHLLGHIQPGAIEVATTRLDLIEGAQDADFIKMDVEGWEQHVWAGMGTMLARGRPLTIFMEFTVARYPDPHGFINEMMGHGFSLNIIDYQLGVQPITRKELFALSHNIDHMLVLQRG